MKNLITLKIEIPMNAIPKTTTSIIVATSQIPKHGKEFIGSWTQGKNLFTNNPTNRPVLAFIKINIQTMIPKMGVYSFLNNSICLFKI